MSRLSRPGSRLTAAPAATPLRRGSARERGYSAKWDRTSLRFIAANPLCLGCEAVGRVSPTEVTDHIVPHKGDHVLFWDPLNRQPACRWHHDAVKARLEEEFTRGALLPEDLRLDSAAAIALTHELGR